MHITLIHFCELYTIYTIWFYCYIRIVVVETFCTTKKKTTTKTLLFFISPCSGRVVRAAKGNHSVKSGGVWGLFRDVFSILVC